MGWRERLGLRERQAAVFGVETRVLVGGRRLSVVGEASYQPALRKVSGAPVSGGWDWEGFATLVPEPTNAYDSNAVMVQIEGRCVGYLSRENAKRYLPVINELVEGGVPTMCSAYVGRSEDGNPNLGVSLHIPDDWP